MYIHPLQVELYILCAPLLFLLSLWIWNCHFGTRTFTVSSHRFIYPHRRALLALFVVSLAPLACSPFIFHCIIFSSLSSCILFFPLWHKYITHLPHLRTKRTHILIYLMHTD
ncbi:hypothetical protein C8R46DRAFT_513729 [Mycena filopes]|nr:hypothetical protein C8R46DRAFT_513729 [Mycena filopes]